MPDGLVGLDMTDDEVVETIAWSYYCMWCRGDCGGVSGAMPFFHDGGDGHFLAVWAQLVGF